MANELLWRFVVFVFSNFFPVVADRPLTAFRLTHITSITGSIVYGSNPETESSLVIVTKW
jgi:hypothetical protein